MSRSLRLAFLSILVGVLLFACHAQVSVGPKDPTSTGAANPAASSGGDEDRIPVLPEDPSRGSETAYVTLVVFTDFRCPFCNRLSPTIDRIREAYPADVLRIVFKHQPSPSFAYAKLASTVGQGVFALKGADAFWRYRDEAFRDQQTASPQVVRKWAMAAGLDVREIDAGLEKGAWADKVERDMALAAKLGVTEPPVSFVNGFEVSGAPPFETFKDAIDVELAKAKVLEQSGVPRAQIYGRAVAANDPNANRRDSELDDPKVVWRVPVGTSPVRGKPTALVTIVEYSDFDCPTCKRAAPVAAKIKADYGDKVRLVWKDMPLQTHPRSMAAAEMARAARSQRGDAGFWDMHDRLFASAKLDDADLETLARSAGLEFRSALAAVKNEAFKKDIEADIELADDIEITATPQYFVNGRRMLGEQPYEKMKAMVDEEIKKAESLLRSGIEPTALYDWFIKDGRPPEMMKKNVPLNPNAPFKGPATAPVAIQIFSEFQCAPCRRADPVLDEVMKAFPNLVRVVWRHLPTSVHPEAPLAAEAAQEAFAQKGNEGFWKMETRLHATPNNLQREDLDSHAKDAGLEYIRFRRALDMHAHKPVIDSEVKVATDLGITSTPAIAVGGYVIFGVPTFARLKRLVARALVDAPSNQSRPPAPPSSGGGVASKDPPAGKGGRCGGFQIVDLVNGSGSMAKAGDNVTVSYVGRLCDGPEFARSGQTFSLGSGAVIQGLDRGVAGMKVGGRRRITVPPEMGFGNHGMGKIIPPNSTLIFEVELTGVN
jgi:protein-disulfide isomerase